MAAAVASHKHQDSMDSVDSDQVQLTTQTQSHGVTKKRLVIAVAVMVVVAVACGIFIVYTSRSRSTGVSVPDTFSAQFIVSPPEGSTDDWKYNGKMYKTKAGASTVSGSSDPDDWVVEATIETVDAETNKRIVYTLHNRRAYYQQFPSPDATTAEESGCMRQSHVPAMGDINNLMKNAAQVPKDEVTAKQVAGTCGDSDAPRYAIQWGYDDPQGLNRYYYCPLDDNRHYVQGRSMQATVWDVHEGSGATPLALSTPTNVTSGQPLECPEIDYSISTIDTTAPKATSRRLGAAAGRRLGSEKKCYFIHGSGYDSDARKANSLSSYWGSVESKVGNSHRCSQIKFIKEKLGSYAFDHLGTVDEICDEVAGGHSGQTISNKIIFTHGSSSLTLALALQNGRCHKGTTAEWYSIGAMWEGTAVADSATGSCPSRGLMFVIGEGLNANGMCKNDAASPAAQSLTPTEVSSIHPDLRSFAFTKLDGAMCGDDAWGLHQGSASISMSVLAEFVFPDDDSDGFVATSGCADSSVSWGTRYEDDFYKAGVNQIDLTCRNGDQATDNDHNDSPCAWIAQRVA